MIVRPIAVTLEMIKFQHSVFALPFAFLAAFVVSGGFPAPARVLWITVAMVGARSAAMAFNRLVDARIDSANPRTSSRALPAGLISQSFVVTFIVVSVAIFLLACWRLNRLSLLLAPVALAVVLGYSLTKRFTSLSHLILGLALAIGPVGAAIAITGRFDERVLPLSAAVLFWTAGFDILYSLQDLEFDRSAGLHSIPARVGAKRALTIARIFHLLTVMSLVSFGLIWGLGGLYFAGVAGATVLLIWQHSIVFPDDLSRIDAAFFTANGFLSIGVFVLGACDILIRT